MSKDLRPLTAEFVGTLLFVFLGAGSVVALVSAGSTLGASSIGPLGVALAHGVGMAIIVSMTMSISGGHINPAVTVGLWIANKIDGLLAGKYIVAQLLGAIAGAALLKGVPPSAGCVDRGAPHLLPGERRVRDGRLVAGAKDRGLRNRPRDLRRRAGRRQPHGRGDEPRARVRAGARGVAMERSEEHTSELQSRLHLVCRLLLEKKKIH